MEKITKEEYNKEPVHYCKDCLSLRILGMDNYNFCDSCGSTNIDTASIDDWNEMYFKKHKYYYIEE